MAKLGKTQRGFSSATLARSLVSVLKRAKVEKSDLFQQERFLFVWIAAFFCSILAFFGRRWKEMGVTFSLN